MARLNAVIDRLTKGEPVFSTIPIQNGAVDELAFVAKSDFDLAMIENEHSGFDSLLLRTSLQYLLSRLLPLSGLKSPLRARFVPQ